MFLLWRYPDPDKELQGISCIHCSVQPGKPFASRQLEKDIASSGHGQELLTQTNHKRRVILRKNHDKCTIKNSHVCLHRKTNQEGVYELNCCSWLCIKHFILKKKKKDMATVLILTWMQFHSVFMWIRWELLTVVCSLLKNLKLFSNELVSSGYCFRECERKLNSSLLNFDLKSLLNHLVLRRRSGSPTHCCYKMGVYREVEFKPIEWYDTFSVGTVACTFYFV